MERKSASTGSYTCQLAAPTSSGTSRYQWTAHSCAQAGQASMVDDEQEGISGTWWKGPTGPKVLHIDTMDKWVHGSKGQDLEDGQAGR
jgi:hypothetical protein